MNNEYLQYKDYIIDLIADECFRFGESVDIEHDLPDDKKSELCKLQEALYGYIDSEAINGDIERIADFYHVSSRVDGLIRERKDNGS